MIGESIYFYLPNEKKKIQKMRQENFYDIRVNGYMYKYIQYRYSHIQYKHRIMQYKTEIYVIKEMVVTTS